MSTTVYGPSVSAFLENVRLGPSTARGSTCPNRDPRPRSRRSPSVTPSSCATIVRRHEAQDVAESIQGLQRPLETQLPRPLPVHLGRRRHQPSDQVIRQHVHPDLLLHHLRVRHCSTSICISAHLMGKSSSAFHRCRKSPAKSSLVYSSASSIVVADRLADDAGSRGRRARRTADHTTRRPSTWDAGLAQRMTVLDPQPPPATEVELCATACGTAVDALDQRSDPEVGGEHEVPQDDLRPRFSRSQSVETAAALPVSLVGTHRQVADGRPLPG